MNRTNLRGIVVATVTFVATAGVVAGIAKGVERFTEDGSPVHATFATDVPRTAVELESWRRAVLAGDDTKRELEAAAREMAEEKRQQAIEERRRAEEAQRRKAEEEARRKAEEEKARKEAEARKKAEAEARKKAEAEARQRVEEEARKKAEAEARKKAEAEERRKAEEAARKKKEQKEAARKQDSGSSGSSTKPRSASTGSPKAIARELVAAKGWGSGQFACLEKLWTRESNWRVSAENPSSGAYGIPQALPGSKMATFGSDWRTNPRTQIKWGLSYIAERYGTPCGAWSAFQSKGWY